MSKISWGPTTVFPSATATPATPAFGTPATPVVPGNTAATPAAPTSGFSFSTPSTPTTPPATNATNAFGYTTTTTLNTTNSTTPSLFSPPAATPTSTTTPNYNSSGVITSLEAPQQAALQAHRNATLYQETSRLTCQLQHFYESYSSHIAGPAPPSNTIPTTPTATGSFFATPTPAPVATPSTQLNPKCQFQHVFYDTMTPQQTLEKHALLSITTNTNTNTNNTNNGMTMSYPPKPPHLSNDTWIQALTHNPDANQYIPILLTSAETLHSRLVQQQSTTNVYSSYISSLMETIQSVEKAQVLTKQKIIANQKSNQQIQLKLLPILLKVELCRCKYTTLTKQEYTSLKQMDKVLEGIRVLYKLLHGVEEQGRNYINELEQQRRLILQSRFFVGTAAASSGAAVGGMNGGMNGGSKVNKEFVQKMEALLEQQERGIEELELIVKKDLRDLEILKRGQEILD